MSKNGCWLIAVVPVVTLHAGIAHALLPRTFVSGLGNDASTCTVTTPCRTFQRAHDAARSGGEIDVLTPAGYGPLTITKSISIQGHGFSGVTTSSGGVGITINASATDVVSLNGLLIDGGGVGVNGIVLTSAKSLSIENCVVRYHSGNGIDLRPNADSSLSVSNTVSAYNGGDGITVRPSGSGAVRVALDRVNSHDNDSSGVDVDGETMSSGTLYAAATDSVVSKNGFAGFLVFSVTASTRLTVARSTVAGNDNGLFSDQFAAAPTVATLWVGQSVITGNRFSWTALAPVLSYGDNDIGGNDDGDPGPPIVPKK